MLFVRFLLCQGNGSSTPFSTELDHEPTGIYPTQSQAHDQSDGKQCRAELDLMHANLQLQGGETHLSSCYTHNPSPKQLLNHRPLVLIFVCETEGTILINWFVFGQSNAVSLLQCSEMTALPSPSITTTIVNEDVGTNSWLMSQEVAHCMGWEHHLHCSAQQLTCHFLGHQGR